MNEYQISNAILKNKWDDMVKFLFETKDNPDFQTIIKAVEEIREGKNLSFEDAFFILTYGDAKVNDKEFYRRLN
jgi:hypothetical protein